MTLLPSEPGETNGIGSPETSATHEPVFSGIRDEFAGAWHDQLKARGYSDGAERLWKLQDGSVIETAESFRTHKDAIAYQRWEVENVVCVTAIEVFAPAVSGGIGLRSPWGTSQTADIVSFVRGNYHFQIFSFTNEVPIGHTRVETFARSAEDAIG